MAREQSVVAYGTVMSTWLDGRNTVHRVEATAPGGSRLELVVIDRKRHRGSVRIIWDPSGHAEPRFVAEMPWGLIGVATGIIATIVLIGWIALG